MTDVSLNPIVAEEHQLKRALGPVSLIMIGIGVDHRRRHFRHTRARQRPSMRAPR
jgi:hypothetical protein